MGEGRAMSMPLRSLEERRNKTSANVTKMRAVVFQEVRFPIKQAPFHFHLAKTSGFGLFFLCQTYKQSGSLEEALLAANYCRNDVRYFYLVGI